MRVYVDANPKETCYVTETGETRIRVLPKRHLQSYTNNEAEYLAVMYALEEIPNVTEILSDSELVVRQLNTRLGRSDIQYAIRAEHLKKLADEVLQLARGSVKFTYVHRTQNKAGKVLG